MKRFLHRLRTGTSDQNEKAFPTRVTDESGVRSLVARLHPVAASADLIRLGPGGDGGYLVPDDLDGIVACYSPGVSAISGFERDCADRGMSSSGSRRSETFLATSEALLRRFRIIVAEFHDLENLWKVSFSWLSAAEEVSR